MSFDISSRRDRGVFTEREVCFKEERGVCILVGSEVRNVRPGPST